MSRNYNLLVLGLFHALQLSSQSVDTISLNDSTYQVIQIDSFLYYKTVATYQHDVLDGPFTKYSVGPRYDRVLFLGNYSNGRLSGPQIEYTIFGEIISEQNYVDGRLLGTSKTYWSDGNPCWVMSYGLNGLDGISRFYTKKGVLFLVEYYENGVYRRGDFIDKRKMIVASVIADAKGEPVKKVYFNRFGEVERVVEDRTMIDTRKL